MAATTTGAATQRWDIVETRIVVKHKTADGGKRINNYALLRTLGHGSFAKVKLCERIAATTSSSISSSSSPLMPDMPPPMAPLRPTFAAAPAPYPLPRRQFAMKIFSKKTLLKMKDYVTQHEHHQLRDNAQRDNTDLLSLDALSLSPPSPPPPPPPPPAHASSYMRVVTALDRVRDEIQIMRGLYHRNIVLLFEVIETDVSDKIYMVIEYMPKGPCMVFRPESKDFVSPLTRSVLSETLARAHVLDILHGLQYLHTRGICHRDLKPDNILLNASGRCHVSDFGCAALLQTPSGQTPRLVTDTVGTYQFLAPECCSGEPYDPFHADVWAVGVLLFIFVFGKLPFQAESTKELFDEITRGDVVFPVTHANALSEACGDLLRRLLCKDVSQRIRIQDALVHPWLNPVRAQEEQEEEEESDEPPSF